MRYHILACDFDGTIAHHGKVDKPTLAALERLLATGRKLVLVSGRELEDLFATFPEVHLFERLVLENGALLYRPATKEEKVLAAPPPAEFVAELRRRQVGPISVGRSIVATWKPHETAVLEVIRDQGLDLQVIFNKEAVMALPTTVNKASGLTAALHELGFSHHETVAIGDAENDHSFLALCECAVAVDNAVPALKERADIVTRLDHGAGVAELIDRMIANDLADLNDGLVRHHLDLGTNLEGHTAKFSPFGDNLLIAGPSGSGKSTAATSILERLAEHAYQFCILDPEGDYENLEGAVTLGGNQQGPTIDEVMQLLATARENVVVNLVGMAITDRPPFFMSLLPRLMEMRARTGRPHWLVVDEAHHLLPASWQPGITVVPRDLNRTMFITVHPDQIIKDVLEGIGNVLAIGPGQDETLRVFCQAAGLDLPPIGAAPAEKKTKMLWSRRTNGVQNIQLAPSHSDRRRHSRKYAEGELPPERSFYFRGPKGKLNLRAQNLILFLQIADGVDDATWTFHLRAGDYSTWLRKRIKDHDLADEVAAIETHKKLTPEESRAQVRAAIERRYTLPEKPPLPMPNTDAKSARPAAAHPASA
jgi:hydroxymethylpyrimidine pyrophosphatase-like HAD family hydrolase